MLIVRMRHAIKGLLARALLRRGILLVERPQYDAIVQFSKSLIENVQRRSDGTGDVDSIVFSKDRAMQVHAFLRSFEERAGNRGPMTVLFRCSDERHKASYSELRRLFSGRGVTFVEETDFRAQLIALCEESSSRAILFFVDDMILTHDVDYDAIRSVVPSTHVLALSRGRDLTYSVVLQRSVRPPAVLGSVSGFDCFRWDESSEYSDWTHPRGVARYMFAREEAIAMTRAIEFRTPNSLEAGMQLLLPALHDPIRALRRGRSLRLRARKHSPSRRP